MNQHNYSLDSIFFLKKKTINFSPDLIILRSGKIYSETSHTKPLTLAMRDPEQTKELTNGISHDLFKETIRAILGPLKEQFSTLT